MWYHKPPLLLPIGKADSIIRFYYACLRVNSVYTCIPYVTNKLYAADSFKWRTAFFPSYILTFIEIEIDITTGSHQLKMRFLFAIVHKNGLFQILGFSSYQKQKQKKQKIGMSDAYQKFCRGHPAYCAAHDFRPFTKVLFSIVMWIRLYENDIFATRENTALIRSTTLQKSIIL